MVQSDFRIYLREELARRKRERSSYSLREFARSLGIDPSALSKILHGKRPIGRKMLAALGPRLGLAPDELADFERRGAGPSVSASAAPADAEYRRITLDSFRIISDWHHYAILELMLLDDFEQDPRWISRTLGIPLSETKFAIERLMRVGLITVDERGRWRDASGGKSTTVGASYSDAAFRNLQRQVLQKALEALDSIPISRRDQTSMTVAIDSDRVAEAKELIKNFRRSLSRFLSSGAKRDQVYHLSVSLYPVTKTREERKKK